MQPDDADVLATFLTEEVGPFPPEHLLYAAIMLSPHLRAVSEAQARVFAADLLRALRVKFIADHMDGEPAN
jgi:hypothetical protein